MGSEIIREPYKGVISPAQEVNKEIILKMYITGYINVGTAEESAFLSYVTMLCPVSNGPKINISPNTDYWFIGFGLK